MIHKDLIRASLLVGVAIIGSAISLVGCNATNDNPVTPDQMTAMANKEAGERANFKPSGSPPPPAAGTQSAAK